MFFSVRLMVPMALDGALELASVERDEDRADILGAHTMRF